MCQHILVPTRGDQQEREKTTRRLLCPQLDFAVLPHATSATSCVNAYLPLAAQHAVNAMAEYNMNTLC